MRFRKRVKVFPGFYLNFSGSGVSTTIGVRGASINFNKTGTYLNTGIPGTGFYDRQKIGGYNKPSSKLNFNPPQIIPTEVPKTEEIGSIKSENTESITTDSLKGFKETILEAYGDRKELNKEIQKTDHEMSSAKFVYTITRILIFGFFIKSFKNKVIEKQEYIEDLKNQLANCSVNIDLEFDELTKAKYEALTNSYKELMNCQIIWDITSSVFQDTRVTRSAAGSTVSRTPVKFKFDNIDIIKSSFPAFHLENANGGDLYLYPAFAIIKDRNNQLGLIGLKELQLNFSQQRFLEEQRIPSDTRIVDETWAKVNKNGTPDKRFKGIYKIPIVRYGQIELKTNTGLNEAYSFSSYEKTEVFANAFSEFKSIIRNVNLT